MPGQYKNIPFLFPYQKNHPLPPHDLGHAVSFVRMVIHGVGVLLRVYHNIWLMEAPNDLQFSKEAEFFNKKLKKLKCNVFSH